MFDVKKIVAGAVAGAVAALVVDLNAWSKADDADEGAVFSWRLAFKRWCAGAVTGALAAMGMGSLPQ